jgi:hypothetical protein
VVVSQLAGSNIDSDGFKLVTGKNQRSKSGGKNPPKNETVNNSKNHSSSKPNFNSNNKQKKFNKPIVIGSGSHFSGPQTRVKAAMRVFHYYVGGWHLDTTLTDVKEHVEKVIGKYEVVEELVCKHDRYKSFRISVEDLLDAKMKSPHSWPRNIRVCTFFFLKPKKGESKVTNSQTKLSPTVSVAVEVTSNGLPGNGPLVAGEQTSAASSQVLNTHTNSDSMDTETTNNTSNLINNNSDLTGNNAVNQS